MSTAKTPRVVDPIREMRDLLAAAELALPHVTRTHVLVELQDAIARAKEVLPAVAENTLRLVHQAQMSASDIVQYLDGEWESSEEGWRAISDALYKATEPFPYGIFDINALGAKRLVIEPGVFDVLECDEKTGEEERWIVRAEHADGPDPALGDYDTYADALEAAEAVSASLGIPIEGIDDDARASNTAQKPAHNSCEP